MIGMRWTQASLAAVVFVWAGAVARAQEPTPEPTPPKPEPAAPPAATPSGDGPWWGGRNLLYLEVGYGSSSVDPLDASVATDLSSLATNNFELTDTPFGRFVVGWTLPNERGRFSVAFEGIVEDGYKLESTGSLPATLGDSSASESELPWWQLTAEDGRVEGVRNPPYWSFTDDLDGDFKPDANEVRYLGADIVSSSRGPSDLGNKLQTIDLLYDRNFGGRRVWGHWSAGLRHFQYSGNIPSGLWLGGGDAPPGYHFSDGLVDPIVVFSQNTKGYGPTGSGGINYGFSRRRFVLFAEARFAFMVQDLETDTGEFLTYAFVNTTQTFLTVPAHLHQANSKSTWHVQLDVGARLRILENTHLTLGYRVSNYMDSVLLPVSLIVPDNQQQATRPATAQFNTRDLRVDIFTLGLSYQF